MNRNDRDFKNMSRKEKFFYEILSTLILIIFISLIMWWTVYDTNKEYDNYINDVYKSSIFLDDLNEEVIPQSVYKSQSIKEVNHLEAYRACVKPKEQVCDGDFKYWERKYRHDPQKALEIRSNCYYEASLKCEGR